MSSPLQQISAAGRWTGNGLAHLLADADLIAPVPLHRWRLWTRRYNQSALLAAEVARISGRRFVPDLAARVRRTRSQARLGQSERNRNVKGAFSVSSQHAGSVMGRKVQLIDYVMTSGATASKCAHALRAAGAAEVDVLVFTLVSGGARDHISGLRLSIFLECKAT